MMPPGGVIACRVRFEWAANYDLPGFYHHSACGFSFADGQSEIRRWCDIRTMPPLQENSGVPDCFDSPGNPDVAWLQEKATRPKN